MEYAKYILLSDKAVEIFSEMGISPTAGRLDMEQVLIELSSRMDIKAELDERLRTLSASDIMSNAKGHGESLVAGQIGFRNFDYALTKNGTGVTLTYSLGSFKDKLPEDIALRSVRVEAQDSSGNRQTFGSTSGSIDVPSFPLHITVEAVLQAKEGVVEMGATLRAIDEMEGHGVLTVRTQPPSDSQYTTAQFIQILSADNANSRQRIESLESGKFGIAIGQTEARYKALETEFKTYREEQEIRIKDMQESLEYLRKKVNTK